MIKVNRNTVQSIFTVKTNLTIFETRVLLSMLSSDMMAMYSVVVVSDKTPQVRCKNIKIGVSRPPVGQ